MEAVELQRLINKESQPIQIDLDSCLIDVSQPIEKEPTLHSINGVSVFTKGNISAITGKAKSRKSFFETAVAAAMLSGECLGMTSEGGRVLFLDTEQSLFHVQRAAKRILRLSGLEPDKNIPELQVYALRPFSVKERIEALKMSVERHRPTFVIIDGIIDMLLNFNDITESSELVGLLMKLSAEYSCHIQCVIHQNKADANMRGHSGSFLIQKSETSLEVSTLNDISTVTAIATRGLPPDDISFRINEEGLPELCGQPTKANASLDKSQNNMRRCLGQSAMSYSKLVEEYMAYSGTAVATTKRHIAELLSMGFISRDEQSLYRMKKGTIDDEDLPA